MEEDSRSLREEGKKSGRLRMMMKRIKKEDA